jgi:hypothetical protein
MFICSEKNLERQKCICESFQIQEECCDTSGEPKTREHSFEKAGSHQVTGSPTVV